MKRQSFALVCKAMVLSCSVLLTAALPAAPVAADDMSIQSLLSQERVWAKLSTKTITVTDINWTYSEGGDPAKPTLLLIHGLAGSRDNWNRVAHRLTPFYHVIIPDLPGHGDTKAPEGYDYQAPNIIESLRRFTETLGITKNLHVAGHSLGGTIALVYASLYFQDTQSLFLIDPAGIYVNAVSPYQKNPALLRDLIVKKPGDLNKLFALSMFDPPFIPDFLMRKQEQLMMQQAPGVSKVIERIIELFPNYQPDMLALPTRSIEAPTLVLWGEQDKIINVGVVKELEGNLKNHVPSVILPNVGHFPIMEADQLVAAHYLTFLAGAATAPNKFAVTTPAPASPNH